MQARNRAVLHERKVFGGHWRRPGRRRLDAGENLLAQ